MAAPVVKKFFLWRRHYFDRMAVSIAAFSLVFVEPVFAVIACVVFGIGVWLMLGRHRSARYGDRTLLMLSVAFSAYGILRWAIDFWTEADAGSRCVPYDSLWLMFMPFAVGVVLVRQPLRTFVVGARIGISIAALMSLLVMVSGFAGRFGSGTNPLIWSYFTTLLACFARFPEGAGQRERVASLSFFYLGILPAIASQSRIILLFYALVLVYDGLEYIRSRGMNFRSLSLVLAMCIGAALFLYLVQDRLRIDRLIREFSGADGNFAGSATMRYLIWKAGLNAVGSAPVFGVGQCDIPEIISSSIPAGLKNKAQFYHFHNLFLNILVQLGVVGLALFAALAVKSFMVITASANALPSWRSNVGIVFFFIAVYGLTGSPFTDEGMTIATIFAIAMLVVHARRLEVRRRRQLS